MGERERTEIVASDALEDAAGGLLEAAGLAPADAHFVAGTLVEADLRGHHSHGVNQLPDYLGLIGRGAVRARPAIERVSRAGGHALIDGGMGPGQLAAREGMKLAIELARECGVAAVAVRRSSHFGAGAYWVQMASRQGMIGFATSNEAAVAVAPFGGAEPALGNLPFAWAIPAGGAPDIVLDLATGVVADGKLSLARLFGEAIPSSWGVDSAGRPAADPAALHALLPFGGPKGYAINILCDALCGPLSGSEGSTILASDPEVKGVLSNHFFLAIDVRAFTPLESFVAAVSRQARALRETRPVEGVERVRLPGERAWLTRKERLQYGIPMPRSILARLAEAAASLGFEARWARDWADLEGQSSGR